MRCSASGMFATDNVNSCTCVVRRLSVTYGFHYCILCGFDLVFAFLLFNSMDTLHILSEINYYYYYY